MAVNNLSDLDWTQVIRTMYDDTKGELKSVSASALVPSDYDSISLSYTGDDLTQVQYVKDAVVVTTLTLSYASGKLTGVVKS